MAAAPLVTLSAPYGAGGSRIGPMVADRLGVTFVDRAVPARVAERLSVSLDTALARDESIGSWLARSGVWLGHVGSVLCAVPPPELAGDEEAFRSETEAVLREYASGPGAVILGRAAALVLRDAPGALHVRLRGDPKARVRQAVALEGVDEATATRLQAKVDDAREAYVRHFYRTDPTDCAHYHLVLDSTALSLEACADLIVLAVESR
jgi:Cytidylate kinase-like family